MSIIKTENLTYTYSEGTVFEKAAIRNINVEIEKGEFIGVIGHTGSGKSTFIQHLNGLLKPTSGKVYINGQDMWENPKEIRKFRFQVGLVFQYPEYQLFEETVYKDIAFGPTNMGLSQEEIASRVEMAAKAVGLTEQQLKMSPFELSGGQKRRAAIAGVMAMRPDVLILDEPTAGLDPKGRDSILEQIKLYHEQQGATIILVSHSMEDIAKYASRVLVLNESEVCMFADVKTVFSHAQQIEEIGLSLPQITKIVRGLAKKGYPIRQDIYTVAQAKEEIIRLLHKEETINA